MKLWDAPGASTPVVQVIVEVAALLVQPAGTEVTVAEAYVSVTVAIPEASPLLVTVTVNVTVPPGVVVAGEALLVIVKRGLAATHTVLESESPVTVTVLTTGKLSREERPLLAVI